MMRENTWPISLRMHVVPQPGAAAQGLVVSRAVLRNRAPALAERAAHYERLQLSLASDIAVFWSTVSCDLPWLGDDVRYLAPPLQRVFLPVGWRFSLPDILLCAALSGLPLRAPRVTPLLLLPDDRGSARANGVRVVELGHSLGVSAVDWRAVSRIRV